MTILKYSNIAESDGDDRNKVRERERDRRNLGQIMCIHCQTTLQDRFYAKYMYLLFVSIVKTFMLQTFLASFQL